jgi:hypothetical protein
VLALALVFMLLGAASATAGAYLVYPPAALIVAGALLLLGGRGIIRTAKGNDQ